MEMIPLNTSYHFALRKVIIVISISRVQCGPETYLGNVSNIAFLLYMSA